MCIIMKKHHQINKSTHDHSSTPAYVYFDNNNNKNNTSFVSKLHVHSETCIW